MNPKKGNAMKWQEQELYMQEDECVSERVFYSTYYTRFAVIDRVKSYLKKFQYKPKH